MEFPAGLTAETRIRRAALALIAEHGYEAATIRAIAGAAGVSPGLVIHHYGSKAGLREAIDAEVVEIISSFIDDHLPAGDSIDEVFEAPEAGFRELFTARPELGAYIRRLFFDGDEAGLQILQQFMNISRKLSAAFEDRGWMRPAPDSEMRDLQLIILEMGPVLFYPLFAAYFEQPPLTEHVHRRWVASEFDIFMHGLFTADAPRPAAQEGDE
ncbi:TetR/AcrR family transcriptional regulator [soil metagenome]